MRVLRAPSVIRGDRLTAALWNETAAVINEGLRPPEDQENGVLEEQVAEERTMTEVARETLTLRVENPDDSSQYANVRRAQVSSLLDSATGELVRYVWLNDG